MRCRGGAGGEKSQEGRCRGGVGGGRSQEGRGEEVREGRGAGRGWWTMGDPKASLRDPRTLLTWVLQTCIL